MANESERKVMATKELTFNKPNQRIDQRVRTYRFFGLTIDRENFKFNIKDTSFDNAYSKLWKMVDPNYVWKITVEFPGKDNGTGYEAGRIKELPVSEAQRKH